MTDSRDTYGSSRSNEGNLCVGIFIITKAEEPGPACFVLNIDDVMLFASTSSYIFVYLCAGWM